MAKPKPTEATAVAPPAPAQGQCSREQLEGQHERGVILGGKQTEIVVRKGKLPDAVGIRIVQVILYWRREPTFSKFQLGPLKK